MAIGTQGPKAVEFKMDGRTIVLIDTPGFDDDKRTDVRILEDIAIWMARKGYLNEEKLDGLIFLHPVTFTRAGGSELSRTKLLEKILGPGAYNRVIITTTMWDYVTDERVIQERLNTRFAKKGTWYKLSRKGASYAKHYDTQTSAHDIIRRIMKITDTQGKPTTLLERQLESEKGRVVNTWAGKAVERDIVKRIKIYQEERSKHLDCRPPASYRNDKVSEHKEEWKRWNKRNEELQKGLAREEAELKKLQNIVVSTRDSFHPP